MNIKNPELLSLFVCLPLLISLFIWSYKRSKKNLLQFCIEKRIPELFPNFKAKFFILRASLLSLCFLFLIISLISPRWSFDLQNIEKQGSNIFIAIDVSKSMLATDIAPNRLFRAKLEIAKLLDKLDGDRIGIIVFAGTSFLQSPLTHDYSMVKDWVQQIDVDSISAEGTSIKSAIETAIRGFSFIQGNEKYLIIVSDGEEQDQKTNELAAEAKKQGIKIISIGIGSAQGAPISYNDELVKDRNGNIVISKLNESLLKDIAKVTDGKYLLSRSGNLQLESIYYNFIKKSLNQETFKSTKTQRWKETYQIFLSIALIFLLLESFSGLFFNLINNRKNQPKTLLLALILFFSLYPTPAQAFISPDLLQGDLNLKSTNYNQAKKHYLKALSDSPRNPRLNYNLGITCYKENDFKQAANLFKNSIKNNAKNDKLKEKAFYNLGNSYFKQEDYKKAINSYKSALKINPEDRNAIFNLKLAEKLLEEQEEKKNNPNPEPKQSNKNQENNQPKNKPEPKPKEKSKLSEEELENLLLQVQEGESKKHLQNNPKKNSSGKHLNPW